MPEPVRSFDRMIIPAPCDADWDAMVGNEEMRFCEHCNLNVTDLSSLNRRDAMDLVARSQGRLCVRFIQGPDGSVLTRTGPEKLYRIRRRVSRIAASAFTATLSVSSAMAQTHPISGVDQKNQRVELIQTESQPELAIDEFTASVSGTIKTFESLAISDVTVVLVDRETGEERTVNSSAAGQYAFYFLPQGEYLLWARKSGFRTGTESVMIAPNVAVNVDVEILERMSGFGIAGAMAMVIEPEDALFKAVSDGDLEKVRTLAPTDPGLNLSERRGGMSLLTEAVERGNRDIIGTLLALGADVNVRNSNGRTALMSLSGSATPEILRDLLSAGAKLNARDDSGASPLMIAAAAGPVRILRDLIEAGAQVDARDSSGETCLFRAARGNAPTAIVQLLEAGVDLNVRNEDGDNAMMAMASDGNFENFRTLLDRGSDRELQNDDGRSLLMLAAMNEDPRLAKLLIELGADVNLKDRMGTTALMLATASGRLKTVILLGSVGADLDTKDDFGETALMKAAMANSTECVQALLKAGADLTKKNNDGKTALALAREYENTEIVELLQSRGAPE